MSVYLVVKEYHVPTKIDPVLLGDDHAIKLGEHLKHPFYFKTYRRTIWYELWRFRKNAITALSKGLAKAALDEYR